MDKSKWEYKKLGEVANCQIGLTYKPTDVVDDGGTIVLRSSNIQENKIALDDIVRVNCNINPSKYVNDGDILMCSRNGSFRLVGKVAKIKNLAEPMSYGAFMTIIRSIYNDFLFYFFLSHSFRKQIFVGQTATINQITTKMLNNISMALPPNADQQRIVAELDCLNEMIALKQEQLKEFDKLAQSIFYDMFGDPVTNEKGWKEGKMGEFCTITSSKRIFANEYCEEGVPFYRGKEITELSKGLPISVELNISQSRYDEIKRDYGIPSVGDILITAVGTIGNIWVVNDNSPFYFKDGNIVWVKDIKEFDPVFFRTILTIQISAYKHEMAQGCAYNALTIVNLKKMKVLLPPLALQQQFAEKIQAIEAQKVLVKKSIAETQQLLDSRMDYYFD